MLGAHLSRSPLETQRPLEPLTAARGAIAPEALDEHRVVGEGIGIIDQTVQDLIIPGRRHTQASPDRTTLRPRLLPPAALEVEDGPLASDEPRFRRVAHAGSIGTAFARFKEIRPGDAEG
jgi:hypothetical protein